MPSKTKTIKINPADFQMSKKASAKKTSKKRDGGDVIKPNKIKKKLLERIKKHSKNANKTTGSGEEKNDSSSYTDEFYDSIGYLSKLAEESQTTSPYNKKTLGKTIKKRDAHPPPHIQVDLSLPEGLKEHQVPGISSIPSSEPSISLSPPVKITTPPPYGCLKGGTKPTFRAWNKTQKTNVVDVTPGVTMPTPAIPTPPTTNEQRLAELRETFKQRHHQIAAPITNTTEPIPAPPVLTPIVTEPELTQNISIPSVTEPPAFANVVGGSYMALQDEQKTLSSLRLPKKTKKTTTRKYGLGKNNKKRVVGVLIKDRQTRKKILDAQKEIRRKSLVDVKKYLNDHGLIKAGSRAPNDVVRKIYESAVMSGEINNTDDEIMAHNFMNV